ncbi:3-hydroxyacyl-CoA dehydrogenase family protein [Microcella alkalica]|uniref:3-hydroxyacyl-CoA dehydrogenase family protein n=1 Tax=Microcella alkalica TaxID=355930 RepID=UPI0015FA662C|nr:3-hydroxyacyl-CoA dehydrogenase family protein [Microcella alkalica]
MGVPHRVGVIGGGRMGAGIAHAFLSSGAHVTISEATDHAARAARERVSASLRRAQERGTLRDSVDHVTTRFRTVTTIEALSQCELIVEAVPETVALKQEVLAAAEAVAPTGVLATNTSSLSVSLIASALRRPHNLVGLHFFNPVPASELVEIVVGSTTPDSLVNLAVTWVAGLGKTSIVVKDLPGFASSRLGVALALEAMRMVEQNVASAADIDTAMTLGYRHPMGPLRTTDIVGLDVRLAIAEHLTLELGPRFAPPEILRAKIAAGELGRKTGKGFFEWK